MTEPTKPPVGSKRDGDDSTLRPQAVVPGGAARQQDSGVRPSGTTWLPEGFDAIGAPLGAGATAVVWPVRHRTDGREFALKVWRRPLADDAERDRFQREVRRHLALNNVSGHIVTYSWAESPRDGLPWIGMERHGESLQQVAEGVRPPLAKGLVLCADLLAGLAAMHQLGMVHRDVKPGNLVTEGGRAKLCDLGLVLDSAAFTQDNAAGTPRYVAPELLAGTAAPSPRTDVYSAAKSIREVLGPDVPEPLAQLLTEAASVNPDDRPADAGEFEKRFRQVSERLGHRLPPPLPSRAGHGDGQGHRDADDEERSTRSARPRRRALAVAALVVVVMVVAVAAIVLRPWDEVGTGGDGQTTGTAGSSTASVPPQLPDAARAPTDITEDDQPVTLPSTEAGRCEAVVEGSQQTGDRPYTVDGTEIARLRTYYSTDEGLACAKLIKPDGSPYAGIRTHMALTLCGLENSCDYDWNAYPIDAGPVVVPSRDGCISWRVSMMDETNTRWLIRGDVQSSGCR